MEHPREASPKLRGQAQDSPFHEGSLFHQRAKSLITQGENAVGMPRPRDDFVPISTRRVYWGSPSKDKAVLPKVSAQPLQYQQFQALHDQHSL
jgi:hypothetical protein